MSSNKSIKKSFDSYSTGIILIGLGVLFLFRSVKIFPWILLIISICYIPGMFIREKLKKSLENFLWFAGLFAIFYYKVIFPGILILIGLQILLSAILKTDFWDDDDDVIIDAED